MDLGQLAAMMLVALLAAVIGAGVSMVFVVIVLQARRTSGRESPTRKFEADAERLHRLTHPDEGEGRGGGRPEPPPS